MPFENVFPRSFTAASISGYAPGAPGVYGITNASEWIYIGQADNIRIALASHLDPSSNSEVMGRRPTGFVFEACTKSRQRERCDRLIVEYAPVCNPAHPIQDARGSSQRPSKFNGMRSL
jgi:hypothetical protein